MSAKILGVEQPTVETMVLLVFLAIVWAGAGVYWLKTRVPTSSTTLRSSRRMPPMNFSMGNRSASVLPIGQSPSLGGQTATYAPGHSLTLSARSPESVSGTGLDSASGISSSKARIRRRNLLFGLGALAALTLVGAFLAGGSSWIVAHLIADAALLGYVLLLVQYQREIELERTRQQPVYARPRHVLAATGTDGR